MGSEPPPLRGDAAAQRVDSAIEGGSSEEERLERRFDAAILEIYLEAVSLGHHPARSPDTVRERGGIAIAREILAADQVHEGLFALFLLGRLDLAVEYQVLLPEYEALFTDEERRTAQMRLGFAQRTGGRPSTRSSRGYSADAPHSLDPG